MRDGDGITTLIGDYFGLGSRMHHVLSAEQCNHGLASIRCRQYVALVGTLSFLTAEELSAIDASQLLPTQVYRVGRVVRNVSRRRSPLAGCRRNGHRMVISLVIPQSVHTWRRSYR